MRVEIWVLSFFEICVLKKYIRKPFCSNCIKRHLIFVVSFFFATPKKCHLWHFFGIGFCKVEKALYFCIPKKCHLRHFLGIHENKEDILFESTDRGNA